MIKNNSLTPITNKTTGKQYRCNNRLVYLLIDSMGTKSFIMANKRHRWCEYLLECKWANKWNAVCDGFGKPEQIIVYSNLKSVLNSFNKFNNWEPIR